MRRGISKEIFVNSVRDEDWKKVSRLWSSALYPFCFLDLVSKKAVRIGGFGSRAPCCPSLVTIVSRDESPYPPKFYDFLKSNPKIVEFHLFESAEDFESPTLNDIKELLLEDPEGIYDAFADACDAWETKEWN